MASVLVHSASEDDSRRAPGYSTQNVKNAVAYTGNHLSVVINVAFFILVCSAANSQKLQSKLLTTGDDINLTGLIHGNFNMLMTIIPSLSGETGFNIFRKYSLFRHNSDIYSTAVMKPECLCLTERISEKTFSRIGRRN